MHFSRRNPVPSSLLSLLRECLSFALLSTMSTQRRFSCFDLLKFNNVNLDPLTETYNMSFYLQYLAKWPQYCFNVNAAHGRPMGYILGKAEGHGESWHGHVTAVTVPPEYRRLGVSTQLMSNLERVSEWDKAYFVDLFVRESNQMAIGLYERLGYSIYRRVVGYYSGVEDAFDMRKPCSRDTLRKSVIPLDHPVYPEDMYED